MEARQIRKKGRREAKQLDREVEQCSTTEEITKGRPPFMSYVKRKAEQVDSEEMQHSTAVEIAKEMPGMRPSKRRGWLVDSEDGQYNTAVVITKERPSTKPDRSKAEQVDSEEGQYRTAVEITKGRPRMDHNKSAGVGNSKTNIKNFLSYSTMVNKSLGAEGRGVHGEGDDQHIDGRAVMSNVSVGLKQRAGEGEKLSSLVRGSSSCCDGKTGYGGRTNSTK